MMKKQRPQLPAPKKKLPKDAARAVKRTDNLNLQEVTAETLSDLLDLPDMRVIRYAIEEENQERFLHVFCEHAQAVALCPRCLTASNDVHDVKERCVRHLDIWGMKTLVHFPQRRFGCSVCGKPFSEVPAWIDPQRRQTQAFELYIYERVKGKTPRCQVARQEGLHEAVVAEIFKRQARRALRATTRPVVRVLGVDEIALRKGHKQYALVLSDLERRCVIAVLPDRRKTTFEAWLLQLSREERRAIKTVSMDMWEAYRQAVQHCLPHAEIVADRFHVMKQLNHKLDLLRRSLQRKAKQNGDELLYQALKGNRWVLLKNRRELDAEQEAQLTVILAASDELRTIYLLREEFRTICDKIHERARAVRFLDAWAWKAVATGSSYLRKFVKTLRNWWQEFLNYFNKGVTQGFVEGINHAIRDIIRRAFGYRNFGNFRLQVLVECADDG
jgi:transposase